MLTLPDALKRCLPDSITWSIGRISDKQGPIFPVEELAISRAVAKRRDEFVAGRTCAREALHALGYPAVALPVEEDRRPAWPNDVVGSIAHSGEWATAIAANRDRFAGIGVDIERDEPLEEDLYAMVLRPEERQLLSQSTNSGFSAIDVAKLIFSIKEASYKAVSHRIGRWVDFQDVSVRISFEDREFFSSFLSSAVTTDKLLTSVEGTFGHAEGYVVTVACLRDEDVGPQATMSG
jgi:4'-phosphopantetheinyl transferase EntD